MKKLIYLFIVVLLSSCFKNDDEVNGKYSFDFGDPGIEDGAENVCLRPLLGFNSFSGNDRVNYKYTYYCDTVNPPVKMVIENSSEAFNIMVDDSCILKPDTKYYWKCISSYKGQEGSSDIYCFTTISLENFNTRWSMTRNCLLSNYKIRNRYSLHEIDFGVDNEFLFGQVTNFTIEGDSVLKAKIYTNGIDDYYFDGLFSFAYDTVQIIGLKYELVNFGQYEDNEQTLVLKKFSSDTLMVFTPNY